MENSPPAITGHLKYNTTQNLQLMLDVIRTVGQKYNKYYLRGSETLIWFFLMKSSVSVLQPNTKGHLKMPLWKLSTIT